MAIEMTKDSIIIPVAPPDGEAITKPGIAFFIRKFLHSIIQQIFSSTSSTAPPQPESERPVQAVAEPPTLPKPAQTLCLHPISVMVQKQDVGKLTFSLAAPITIALLITSAGKSQTLLGHLVLAGLAVGCTLIWNGILFRTALPKAGNVMEHVGIAVVMVSFNGMVASALPPEFAWVPVLCGCCCVFPFVVDVFEYDVGGLTE